MSARKANMTVKLFGVIDASFKDLNRNMVLPLAIFSWVSGLSALFFGAWVFMALWAWYVPVFWTGAPILGYWHSLVTFVLLYLFFRRGKVETKD